LCIIGLLSISVLVSGYHVGNVDAQGSWWDSSWPYRKTITVDHSKVAADLINFPVLIDIVDADLMSKAQGGGEDIVFTDYSGIKLNHEIESYDNKTGHLVCWVNTNLSSTTDKVLEMYYGNPSATNEQNPEGVWDSNFVMVQHLAETSASPFSSPDWHKYEGNPILNGSRNGFASVFYDSGVYHLFCSWGSILHFTSLNGITGWTPDPSNPVLSGKNDGVPMVWKEGSIWYMLYRYDDPVYGSQAIGLANSTDATNWTRYEGNPVLTEGGGLDPWGIIKVGSTYYLWYNDGFGSGARAAALATSTDLKNWTKDPNNPIFTGGRFCVFPFKYGSYYYMLVPHYSTFPFGQVELYRCSSPTFYAGQREYLGVVINPGSAGAWDMYRQDTPAVLTDTIYRDTYVAAGNQLWTYYASTPDSGGDWWTGMCIEQNITDALTRFGQPAPYSHFDSTANHNNGQANGDMNLNVTGIVDGADAFDGSNDYVNCGDNSTLKGMSALTVEAWVKPNAVGPGGAGVVSKWSSWSSGSYIMYWGSAGGLGWGVITSPSTYANTLSSSVTIGQWQHLVGTYDGSQINLYKNAIHIGTSSLTGTVMSQTTPCYIGRYTTPFLNGTIDEVRISNVSRSADWILTEYNNQMNPSAFCNVGTEEVQMVAKVFVTPSLIEKRPIDVGTTFEVNVTVRNVTDFFGFDFNLTWDTNLIGLAGVDYESPLDSIWGSGNWVMVKNETTPGWYKLVAVSTRSGFNSTGDHTLARLMFRVEGFYNWKAETNLHFVVVKLSNSNANPIGADAVDGTYRIDAQKPSTEITPSIAFCRKYSERFNVSVNIGDALGVKDCTFEIHYNTTLLGYVVGSDVWGDLGAGTITVNETAGIITGSVTSSTPMSGRLWLLNLTFEDALRHVWRNETLVPGWRNDQSGRIWLRWANLSYVDHADLRYEEGGADEIVVTELEYVFSPIQGDVDNDGDVDVFDLRIVACYYEIDSSNRRWVEASKYDLNGDNIIDIYDLVIVGDNFEYKYDC
jgi:hypothetical protein